MRKILISSMIGNALEWYDFVLYVQFAKIISQLFFPSTDEFTSLLATFGVFAVGFVMRPLGGILFGMLGDMFGRKAALVFSILMMAVPTAMIGFIPTYSQIGVAAPILLTLMRLLQGLALGGGFSGCMTFIVEHSPDDKRGLIGSTTMFSLGAGVFLGIIVSLGVSNFLSEENFITWGWRVPFIISLAIGTVAFYIKKYIDESPVYLKAKEHGKISKTPIHEVFFNHWQELLIAIALYLTVTVPFYALTGFFSTFLQNHGHLSLKEAMTINGIAIFIFMFAIPLTGWISDIYGRKKALVTCAFLIAALAYPCFKLISMGGIIYPLLGQTIFGIAVGSFMGPIPATLVELFPTNIRFTGLALSYNFSAAIFGGTTPFVCFKLIEWTGSHYSPVFYIFIFIIITLFALYHFTEHYKDELAEE